MPEMSSAFKTLNKPNGYPRESEEALELLPAPLRIQAARAEAETRYRDASAKKALASARDLLEIALRDFDPLASALEQARARLLMGIALRRSGDRVRAAEETAVSGEILTRLMDTPQEETRIAAAEIQVDLFLEEAIRLFLTEDFIESARKNERAAKLSAALSGSSGKLQQACRAWLNAAVSWNRCGEVREVRACLERGQGLLERVSSSTLHVSYLLFSWRLGLDRGPLAPRPELPAYGTLSQKTLYLLYSWEYTLLTASHSLAEDSRQAILSHLKEVQDHQFDPEIATLSTLSASLHLGQKSAVIAEGPLATAAALCDLFVKSRWKKLEALTDEASKSSHPVTRCWGHRARAWLLIKGKSPDESNDESVQALELAAVEARTQGLDHLESQIKDELNCLRGLPPQSEISRSPQEKKVFQRWNSLLPERDKKFIYCTRQNRRTLNSAEAATIFDTKASRPKTPMLIDGPRGLVRTSETSEPIYLDKMPIQKKMIFSLIAAYPEAVSKEDLVSRVWDELYNPLVHDSVLYRTISRCRKLLGGKWIRFENGAVRWGSQYREFIAVIPIEQGSLQESPLDARKIRILTLLKYRGRITRAEAVQALEAPERTVARDLGLLAERKLIMRQGAGRGTVYVATL